MPGTLGTLQLRAIGGEYRIMVQAPDVFAAVDDWLSSTIIAANLTGVGTNVFEGWVLETASIPQGSLWVTYRWVRNNAPDKITMGPDGTRGRVSDMIYEILAWTQGKSYNPAKAAAAALVPLLDVAHVATTGGYITGAELYQPVRGYYQLETGG